MEKWTRQLSRRMDRLQQRVQSALEKDPSPDESPFEPSRDPLVVEGLAAALPTDEWDRTVVIFERLAGLFEAGVLLDRQGDQWTSRAIFHHGRMGALGGDQMAAVSLPDPTSLSALRAPGVILLSRLGLSFLDPNGDCQALLLRPLPDVSFILLSRWPDLWLKGHLEKVIDALAKGFAP